MNTQIRQVRKIRGVETLLAEFALAGVLFVVCMVFILSKQFQSETPLRRFRVMDMNPVDVPVTIQNPPPPKPARPALAIIATPDDYADTVDFEFGADTTWVPPIPPP